MVDQQQGRRSTAPDKPESADIDQLYEAADIEGAINDPETAHLVINKDQIAGKNDVEGLFVKPEEIDQGVRVEIKVEEGSIIEKPVHMCFGVTDSTGLQKIVMDIDVEADAKIGILAHCLFPRAEQVKHVMDADIHVGPGAEYTYLEKHVHSPGGGVEVIPRAEVELERGARFRTDFELLEGRVGTLDIDYETTCREDSLLEMTAKVDGTGADFIDISESGHLIGRGARGVLNTRVAVRDEARAEVYNTLTATAPDSRGHVDCKEIVQGNAEAKAVPIVDVKHPGAHVTHEAAIGSVDTKQLQTLLARGLTEEQAVDLIIQGLLS